MEPQGDEGPAELFPCADLCRKSGTRLLDPDARAGLNCALPGWDRRRNTGERLVRLRVYMGAPRNYDREGQDHDWDRPLEPAENGCPGSWTRSPFVESVLRYARRPDGNGGRIPNRLLELCDDELVIEAVEALESYEDAARNEYQAAQFAKHKREGAAHGC